MNNFISVLCFYGVAFEEFLIAVTKIIFSFQFGRTQKYSFSSRNIIYLTSQSSQFIKRRYTVKYGEFITLKRKPWILNEKLDMLIESLIIYCTANR